MSQVCSWFDSGPPFLSLVLKKLDLFHGCTSARNDALCEDHDTESVYYSGVMYWWGRQITMNVTFDLVALKKCTPLCGVSAFPKMHWVRLLLCILHFLWGPQQWMIFFLSSVVKVISSIRLADISCWNNLLILEKDVQYMLQSREASVPAAFLTSRNG